MAGKMTASAPQSRAIPGLFWLVNQLSAAEPDLAGRDQHRGAARAAAPKTATIASALQKATLVRRASGV
jgi:hypothetical protein